MRTVYRLLCSLILAWLLPHYNAAADDAVIRLATTTSTENSGLLNTLLPAFEKASGYTVQVIAVGTGKALKMGETGDADVLLVHAPAAEKAFVAAGFGVARRPIMYNDFVIVGPASDPAQIGTVADAAEALGSIAAGGATFLSRGDDSGTHKKERGLWTAAKTEPTGTWYRETGQGMGRTLLMTEELDGYTLTDRGTWLAMRDKLKHLRILVEGDQRLHNPYGAIAVNPERHAHVNQRGAAALIDWLGGDDARRLIANYRLHGEVLFHPNPAAGDG